MGRRGQYTPARSLHEGVTGGFLTFAYMQRQLYEKMPNFYFNMVCMHSLFEVWLLTCEMCSLLSCITSCVISLNGGLNPVRRPWYDTVNVNVSNLISSRGI
jgi:hypothetical protein